MVPNAVDANDGKFLMFNFIHFPCSLFTFHSENRNNSKQGAICEVIENRPSWLHIQIAHFRLHDTLMKNVC